MAGVYIHVPFCKQACHYCDFHFSTQMKKKDAMVDALVREMELRKNELGDEVVETIYFGGGTPSVLELPELERLIQAVYDHYKVMDHPEITLEANPDDLVSSRAQSRDIFKDFRKIGVNRLSIGIQSFFEEDLKLMNRAHNALEAEHCIKEAAKHFDNITIDLIYGIPGMGHDRWKANIQKALDFGLPHISSYALTVEPKTALEKLIQKGTVPQVDDGQAQEQFHILVEQLEEQGFVNYEISNFGKPGYFSQNNTAYWQGKKYLGIGPSAHSYDGFSRTWNIRNNSIYIKQIQQGILPSEKETLTVTDRYNEYVMTGLRTIWGVSKEKIAKEFGLNYANYLEQQAEKFTEQQLLFWEDGLLRTTKHGKFLADGIAADLFFLE
ncbi:oxygen-independent coproporphyrinogen-3 oxidase [Flagellimonas taeanensis]|uniref:Heme chaperone HemW n=1 Tax=Flagellimonas taeanensis TaxID=1005926 RepID=A0A1M6T7P8_9FLAO|nr:radical SAM family heme chaperone HemW [Allomuricauda taeanensis]MEE1962083.1 radical SAM family heme chaperone HemW [Allomuricauda taeanensis]SFB86157.1 oxygen-independent coproporphyrinogen-3 oxidase [Allomuricauda taeanensis]SHK53017.1 oxygen-independent coproporphyrinogen-3 oxidase [Allomuricauda taeanensis]